MNLQEMILEVRSAVNELTPNFWSDSEITRWLNQAVRIMCAHALPLQAFYKTTTVAGQQEYVLPVDVVRIYSVKYIDGRVDNLTATDFATAQSGAYGTGRPQFFYLRRAQQTAGVVSGNDITLSAVNANNPAASRFVLGFVPIPSDAKSFVVGYFSNGMLLRTLGDEPPLGEEYHDGICAYAIAKAKEKDEAYMEASQIYWPRFSEYVEKLKSAGVLDGQDSFPSVNVMGEDVSFDSPLDPRFLVSGEATAQS